MVKYVGAMYQSWQQKCVTPIFMALATKIDYVANWFTVV